VDKAGGPLGTLGCKAKNLVSKRLLFDKNTGRDIIINIKDKIMMIYGAI
jgi:hypothetical protein